MSETQAKVPKGLAFLFRVRSLRHLQRCRSLQLVVSSAFTIVHNGLDRSTRLQNGGTNIESEVI